MNQIKEGRGIRKENISRCFYKVRGGGEERGKEEIRHKKGKRKDQRSEVDKMDKG